MQQKGTFCLSANVLNINSIIEKALQKLASTLFNVETIRTLCNVWCSSEKVCKVVFERTEPSLRKAQDV